MSIWRNIVAASAASVGLGSLAYLVIDHDWALWGSFFVFSFIPNFLFSFIVLRFPKPLGLIKISIACGFIALLYWLSFGPTKQEWLSGVGIMIYWITLPLVSFVIMSFWSRQKGSNVTSTPKTQPATPPPR